MKFVTVIGIYIVVLVGTQQTVRAVRVKPCPFNGAIKCTSKCSLGKNAKGCDVCICPKETNPCPAVEALKCSNECPMGLDENSCKTCICLPPMDSKCPPLVKCREGCSVGRTNYSDGCPRCLECPDAPDRCPMFKCVAGSIMGNPSKDGCDVCVSPPEPREENVSRHRRDPRPPPCGAFIVCNPPCHFEQDPNQSCPTCVCDKLKNGGNY